MADPARESHRVSTPRMVVRSLFWLAAPLLALVAVGWLAPSTARAGTITIVDGIIGDNDPANGVFADGFIQNYLNITGSLTISTTSVVTGPDEIRVLGGAVITWTTGSTLTLDAGASVIVTGTIQHDGPADGAGGLALVVSGIPTGTVVVGPGDQNVGVAAGSRHGLTRVQAGNLTLSGGADPETYAQLGFYAVDEEAGYTVTGAISVTVSQNVSATGGGGIGASVQIGHGGGDIAGTATAAGDFSGPISVEAGGDVTFLGGGDFFAYAQLGHGGVNADGNHGGSHHLHAGGKVRFEGGSGNTGYAQFGNGGTNANGNHSGSHHLSAGGDVAFQGGSDAGAYAQMGNGGMEADGDHTNQHRIDAGGDVAFVGGSGALTYAQFGNGGYLADGNQSNGQTLIATGDVTFEGGSSNVAYAQFGNGGGSANGNHSGGHFLTASGDVRFQGGDDSGAYAQFGNGGNAAIGNQSSDHQLVALGDVSFEGGSAQYASAQMGNGGLDANGNHSGNLLIFENGSLTVTAGSGVDAFALIGHGADARAAPASQGTGSRAGNISLQIGMTATFSGSQVGHVTISGTLSVTTGNTLIGVSQQDPYASGTGRLLVTGVQTTSFGSAPDANGGQLRLYIPREDSQQIPTNATFNGETFTTANTIPPAQLAGFALFGDGPYIPDYSFYIGGQPDMAITKTATPVGPFRPGDAITYTVSFSNTGTVTATDVVVHDAIPSVLTGTVATPLPDPGVTISQTSGPPNFAWNVSSLGPGKGGQIVITATLENAAEVLGATFTNGASVFISGDITDTNNLAEVTRSVVAGATLTVTKVVSGSVPDDPWQFGGSGSIGSFTLPAAGGSQVIGGLLGGSYTISETVQAGYTAAVACTDGANGAESVQVTLDLDDAVACTFTNSASGPAVRVRAPAIHVGP